jgi:hypothetical protein
MKKSMSKKIRKSEAKKVQNKEFSRKETKALEKLSQDGQKKLRLMTKKSVKDAIEFGQILMEAEEIISKTGKWGNWGKYLKESYPSLQPKTAQRYMQLAEHVDLNINPTLAFLGQAKLLRLIQLGDGKTPAEVLYAGEMDIDFDSKDADSQKQFQSEAAALIKRLETERRESKAEESHKEPGEEAAKVLKKLYELLKQPEELEGLWDLLEEDETLQAMRKSVRISLRKQSPKGSGKTKVLTPSEKLSARRKGKKKKVSATA